jgi:23S rRNA pseudouridine1911/1915/1917 synthase
MENIIAAGHHYGVKHLKAHKTEALFSLLHSQLGLHPPQIEQLLNLGAIYLNDQRLACASRDLLIKEQDYLRVHTQPRRFPVQLIEAAFQENRLIHFEHPDFYIIHKPSGVPVHASVDNTQENLLAFLESRLQKKLFITHRLDVPTSGLIFVAKNLAAQKQFNQLLENSLVTKFYKALVHGEYEGPRRLTHYMQPSPRAPKLVSTEKSPGWLLCQLDILDCEQAVHRHSLLSIQLLTGRTHQIRAQLSATGHPIVGDKTYGSPVVLDDSKCDKIALESFHLAFPWQDQTFSFRVAE